MNDPESGFNDPGSIDLPARSRAHDWNGDPLTIEGAVAFLILGLDTSVSKLVQDPVIAATRCCDSSFIVRKKQIATFLTVHSGTRLICHNAGALHGMLEADFKKANDLEALRCLWKFSRSGRMFDVALLDQLLDMAKFGIEKGPCRLAEIARNRSNLTIPDMKEVNLIINRYYHKPALELEEVALSLVHALMTTYEAISPAVDKIVQRCHEEIDQESGDADDQRYLVQDGPLSVGIQVRGTVAADRISRGRGLRLERVKDLIECCEAVYQGSEHCLMQDKNSKICFNTGAGKSILIDDHGRPIVYNNRLRQWLESCVADIRGIGGFPFRSPHSSCGTIALAPKFWGELSPYHPGLNAWILLESSAVWLKHLKRTNDSGDHIIRPQYQAMPRFSSANPDLENLRKMAGWPIFTAPSGYRLLVGKMADLDLRLLANTYSASSEPLPTMAMIFEKDLEPCRYAATALWGIETFRNHSFPKGFDSLELEDPESFKAWMFVARTVLREIPRGLSHESIAAMIGEQIGVSRRGPTVSIIHKACQIIQDEIFPELSGIGKTRTIDLLVEKLCIQHQDAFVLLGGTFDGFGHEVRNVLLDNKSSSNIMRLLCDLCTDDEMRAKLESAPANLYDEIFRGPRTTGFGRVRSMLECNQSEASVLLDAADDIRKSVFYEIVSAGHELIAQSGDEFVILLPDGPSPGRLDQKELGSSIKTLVEEVLSKFFTKVPVKCELTIRDAW